MHTFIMHIYPSVRTFIVISKKQMHMYLDEGWDSFSVWNSCTLVNSSLYGVRSRTLHWHIKRDTIGSVFVTLIVKNCKLQLKGLVNCKLEFQAVQFVQQSFVDFHLLGVALQDTLNNRTLSPHLPCCAML